MFGAVLIGLIQVQFDRVHAWGVGLWLTLLALAALSFVLAERRGRMLFVFWLAWQLELAMFTGLVCLQIVFRIAL